MFQNVRYSNGRPCHITLPFEYRTPKLSSFHVLGIQKVTVTMQVQNANNGANLFLVFLVTWSLGLAVQNHILALMNLFFWSSGFGLESC